MNFIAGLGFGILFGMLIGIWTHNILWKCPK